MRIPEGIIKEKMTFVVPEPKKAYWRGLFDVRA